MNHIVDRLKYGYMLVKYAKSAYNPHDKKFYVSLDGKKLCWEDKDSNGKDVKSLKMDEILSVNLGDIGDGIEKHVGSKKKIPNLDCYGIVLSSNKERKSLEVGSKSP